MYFDFISGSFSEILDITMPSDEDWIDDDIASMELSYAEKSGLQVYRNYTESFENHAIGKFRETLSREVLNLDSFERLVEILIAEDVRFLPVIVCGYADESLKAAFLNMLPKDVPGGVKGMLSGYGPLSDLSKRIRLAYAFDVISQDLCIEIDRVREVRNRVSHDWDLTTADALLDHPKLSAMFPVEAELVEYETVAKTLTPDSVFRMRLVWLAGRLTYEAATYHRASDARLRPNRALYEDGGTTWLTAVSQVCMKATRRLIA